MECQLAAMKNTHPHTISDVAEMIGVTHRALRFYEELHLVSPKRISGSRRLYNDADVARLKKITHIARLGFSLLEVKQLLKVKSMDQFVNALQRRRDEVSIEIENLQQVRRNISDEIAAARLTHEE